MKGDADNRVKMGMIKEPMNVNFSVLDKQWTAKELSEFSDFVASRKKKQKKSDPKNDTKKSVRVTVG